MKNIICLVMFITASLSVSSQDLNDMDLLHGKLNQEKVELESEKKGIYHLYKDVFSEQILNDCIYDRSCSGFSKDVFRHFGLVKGLMLTADRLTRCNRATHAQVSKMMMNDQGRVLDHWDYYVKK